MRRLSSVLLQAVESTSIALATLVLTLVPAVVTFAAGGLSGDAAVPWRIAVDAWMLGHGVDVGVALGDAAVAAVGTDAAAQPFVLGVGAWGIGLATILLAARSGMRLARTAEPAWGLVGGVLATSAVGVALALTAQHEAAAPNVVHAAIGPAACMLLGLAIGALWEARDVVGDAGSWLAIDASAVPLVRASLRAGLAVAAAFVGLGAVLLAIALLVRQADVIGLFEALQPDHLGVVVLWLVQLALLPTAVVWSTSWMLGPGFAIGAGSSVSPLGTDLGPVPTLPLLGAIAPGVQPWSLVVVVVPLVAAVGIGALVRQRSTLTRWWQSVVVAVGGGVVAGAVLAALAAATSGGMGPGRLDVAGPTWWIVGLVAAGVAAVGLTAGLLSGRSPETTDGDVDDDHDDADTADLDVAALAAAARARAAGETGPLPSLSADGGGSASSDGAVAGRLADAETAPVAPLAATQTHAEAAPARPLAADEQETEPVLPLEDVVDPAERDAQPPGVERDPDDPDGASGASGRR
ncbi:cell division protein PerM [Agrococcus sp. SGAir0287]|uniref:cell division protein PerM n=1 Tax=Agrococcus sp. SGAir0287 TaxID=2070347 RepID=UPI0010CCE219|nr:DUF6350 family protein [Agrococcus sp. SGAir0287]QCR19987.1 hypothetical protein C1N71_11535 [Agrococcus sp. SGAir0287]